MLKRFLKLLSLLISINWPTLELRFERYIRKCTVFCTNIHLDVIDLVHHGMVKNTKFDYLENETTFLRNKKIINLCLRWHILRSYRFIVEVTFNDKDNRTTSFQTSHMMSFQCLYFKTFLEFPLLTELINASWELFNISYGSFRFKKNYPE